MNGFISVSFEAFAECIDLASGDPGAFKTLMLKRSGDLSDITITEQGKPCFEIQMDHMYSSKSKEFVDTYADELDHWI